MLVYPPTRVFWQKRLQVVENKEWEAEKERKEIPKRLQVNENKGKVSCDELREKLEDPTPPGFCTDVKRKGLRGKGFVRI